MHFSSLLDVDTVDSLFVKTVNDWITLNKNTPPPVPSLGERVSQMVVKSFFLFTPPHTHTHLQTHTHISGVSHACEHSWNADSDAIFWERQHVFLLLTKTKKDLGLHVSGVPEPLCFQK